MNSGASKDDRFNGHLEIELITPLPVEPGSVYAAYLEELLNQMKTVPQSYKAANGKDPLHLSVCWHASAGDAKTWSFPAEKSESHRWH